MLFHARYVIHVTNEAPRLEKRGRVLAFLSHLVPKLPRRQRVASVEISTADAANAPEEDLQESTAGEGEGEEPAAERTFVAAREGFLAENQWYDAALASLDLAVLYADRGRSGELRSLAEELVPLFEAHGVHREALAALLLFRGASGSWR